MSMDEVKRSPVFGLISPISKRFGVLIYYVDGHEGKVKLARTLH